MRLLIEGFNAPDPMQWIKQSGLANAALKIGPDESQPVSIKADVHRCLQVIIQICNHQLRQTQRIQKTAGPARSRGVSDTAKNGYSPPECLMATGAGTGRVSIKEQMHPIISKSFGVRYQNQATGSQAQTTGHCQHICMCFDRCNVEPKGTAWNPLQYLNPASKQGFRNPEGVTTIAIHGAGIGRTIRLTFKRFGDNRTTLLVGQDCPQPTDRQG